jgi:RNA polymerase sigma-70 factor (ECF subfamily)
MTAGAGGAEGVRAADGGARPPGATLELTRAVAGGDAAALTRLYEDWFGRMHAEARRTTGRGEDFCLDVVQDAMLRVIRRLPPLDSEARLGAWLRRTVRSCAYDRLRREARRRRREEARPAPEAGAATSAEQAAELAERLEWLRARLAETDGGALDLITMRHRFGWSLARIGAALGLKTGAVDGRVSRALRALRAGAEDAPAHHAPGDGGDR